MTEEWRPVPGFEGYYEVSDIGRVRSVTRLVSGSRGGFRTVTGALRKPWTKRESNHQRVSLWREGDVTRAGVHGLVLAAFVGPCPDGMEACHNDGNPLNNRASNLRWDTRSANALDRTSHGNDRDANKTHCIRGHAFDEENTRLYQGKRRCRQCGKDQARLWRSAQVMA